MQKDSQVVQIIIRHKVIRLFSDLKDERKKNCIGSGTQYMLRYRLYNENSKG